MRREDRPHRQFGDEVGDDVRVDPGRDDRGRHLLERAAGLRAIGPDVAGALDLFGDVREVEVDGERTGELGRGLDIGPIDAACCRGRVGAHALPDLFDEIEQPIALLAHDGLAEQGAELADLAAQLGLMIRVL